MCPATQMPVVVWRHISKVPPAVTNGISSRLEAVVQPYPGVGLWNVWPRLKPREMSPRMTQWPNDHTHQLFIAPKVPQGLFSGAQSFSTGENPCCCYGESILRRRPQTTKVNGSRNLEYWSDTPPHIGHSQSAQVHVPWLFREKRVSSFQEVIQTDPNTSFKGLLLPPTRISWPIS